MSKFVRERQAHDAAMTLVGTMSYDEAIKAVVGSTNAAWAFLPCWRKGRLMGGEIWFIEPHTEDDPEYASLDRGYWVGMDGGDFRSYEGEEDSKSPEEAEKSECAGLRYTLCTEEQRMESLGTMPEFTLAALLGYQGDPESCSWLSRIEEMARKLPGAPSIAPNP